MRLRRLLRRVDNSSMLAARSLLWVVGTLAVVALLWLTLLSGGGGPTALPDGGTVPSGATSGEPAGGGYTDAIDSARGAVQQSNQDAQRAADSATSTP
jgi:hypothetical protein